MRSICRLSRRWHQQFCLSPSFTAHQQCLQHFQPVRQYRQPVRTRLQGRKFAASSLGNPDVHEFEQQGDDASTRRPVHNPLDPEAAALKAELDKLDQELEIMKEGPFGPNSDFIRSFSADEREELLKALEEEGVMPPESADLLSEDDLDDLARAEEGKKPLSRVKSPLKVTLSIPVRDKIYVKRFNTALEVAQQKDDDKEYFALWKWYLRCQQRVSNFALIIPEDVWHFLWRSQSTRFYRPKHLAMLGKDMITADISLEDKEWIEYIDALQATGDVANAVEIWEAQRSRLGANEELAELFWITGVRLYVQLGKPQKAQRLAFECYEHTTIINSEVLMLVISAWAKSQAPNAGIKTWSCYLELCKRIEARADHKTRLGVLGRISSILLEAKRPNLALAVFKDMFLLQTPGSQNSLKIYRDHGEALHDISLFNEDLATQIGLSALATFPQTFSNKYFFAAWIKWLLGDGRVDDAALVVELTYERGVKLDAGPMNGLIAACFRRGSPKDREVAEQTAWAMIQSRIEMVQERQARGESAHRGKPLALIERRRPFFLKRGAPAATIETFSILLQHYTRRADLARAGELTDVMTSTAQIKPNSFIMNHWLYASLRSGQIGDVWTKFSSLKLSIPPDLETFAALWDTAKTAYAFPHRHEGAFPEARTLFTELQEWFRGLEAKKQATTQADFSPELYEQIIRCFCLSSDPQGTLCALHGLKQSFNALPHEEVSRLIIMQVARAYAADFAPLSAQSYGLRLRMRKNLQYQSAVKTLTEIVVTISDKMEQETDLDLKAVAVEESEAAQELRLRVLTAFLCLVLEKRLRGLTPEQVVQRILAVGEEMKTSMPVDLLQQRQWGDVEIEARSNV